MAGRTRAKTDIRQQERQAPISTEQQSGGAWPKVDEHFALDQILTLINRLWDEFHHYQAAARDSAPPNKDLLRYLSQIQSNLQGAITAYNKMSGEDRANEGPGAHDATANRTNALIRQIVTEPDRFATFLSVLSSNLEEMANPITTETADKSDET